MNKYGFEWDGCEYSELRAWLCKEREMAKGKGPARRKEEKVFHEYGEGKLHSGSKHGPIVKSHRQAIAIALSEGRKAAHGKRRRSK